VYNVHADRLALFSLLSTRFGGDGEQHFALTFYRFAPEMVLNFIIALQGRCQPRPKPRPL
jgi:microcystin-dependent protein